MTGMRAVWMPGMECVLARWLVERQLAVRGQPSPAPVGGDC
jgi:hypothetical protein